jgi:AAA15 family ATPase/GTPase
MLRYIHFTNFKSWAKAELPCGQITGVFGTNSSGKTSLIQFLLLMKQTKDATDRATSLELNGDVVQLGTIKDAIHQHDETKSISWSLGFRLPSELALSDPSEKKTSIVAKGRNLTLRV